MPRPDMHAVDSSNIREVGYDAGGEELWVEFVSGATYVYAQVPQLVFDEFVDADSKGSYLNREIRNAYECRQE
jgi:hypothetical protein